MRKFLKHMNIIEHAMEYKENKMAKEFTWKREQGDRRDYFFTVNRATKLPTSIDLRANATPVEDQGGLGSCTGNAIAESIELVNKKAGKMTEISRLFIYYQERVYENTVHEDAGAYIRDGIKVTYTYGAPLETLWPYDESKWDTQPSPAAYADAANRKVTKYQKCVDFNAVKNALATGFPVVVGFDVYSSFESYSVALTGMMPYPNVRREQLLGGHAVAIVGYNDNFNGVKGNGRFIVKNSWGSNWGDHGYFYMPYQVIQNKTMSDDFWAITKVNNP